MDEDEDARSGGTEEVVPKKLVDCVKQVQAKSGKRVNAYAVCQASTGLKFKKHGKKKKARGK